MNQDNLEQYLRLKTIKERQEFIKKTVSNIFENKSEDELINNVLEELI
jgi:hypothetical protein